MLFVDNHEGVYIYGMESPQGEQNGMEAVDNFLSGANQRQRNTPRPASQVFQRIGELVNFIPAFKEFYYQQKREDMNLTHHAIQARFNEKISPDRFYPYPAQYMHWRRKWDIDIARQFAAEGRAVVLPQSMTHDLIVTDEHGNVLSPREEDLEKGAMTLAGALLNDANRVLSDDKELEDIYTPDELIKRKSYALNVMSHVSKFIQGNRLVALKANAEKRETANFLMDLMKRSTAGKITDEDIASMQGGIVEGETVHA